MPKIKSRAFVRGDPEMKLVDIEKKLRESDIVDYAILVTKKWPENNNMPTVAGYIEFKSSTTYQVIQNLIGIRGQPRGSIGRNALREFYMRPEHTVEGPIEIGEWTPIYNETSSYRERYRRKIEMEESLLRTKEMVEKGATDKEIKEAEPRAWKRHASAIKNWRTTMNK